MREERGVAEAGREPRASGRGDDLSMSYRKSSPPQNRDLDIIISSSEQKIDDFVGQLTF